MVHFRIAFPKDLPAIEELLRSHDLPPPPGNPSDFVVAVESNQVIGCAGLEIYEDDALLRSVAVDGQAKGQRHRQRIILSDYGTGAATRRAQSSSADKTTAENFFRRLEFEVSRRNDAPPAIKTTSEFAMPIKCCLHDKQKHRQARGVL